MVEAENQELPQQLGGLLVDQAQLAQLIQGDLLQPGVAGVTHQPGVGLQVPTTSHQWGQHKLQPSFTHKFSPNLLTAWSFSWRGRSGSWSWTR